VISVASDISPSIISIIIFGVIAIVVAVVIIANTKRVTVRTRYQSYGASRYVSGQFSKQMELDMRLPYRRFKQLYPSSTWTYDEYKNMQKRTAFRRSTSSQQNKRMVR
jgi:hypothetical protein